MGNPALHWTGAVTGCRRPTIYLYAPRASGARALPPRAACATEPDPPPGMSCWQRGQFTVCPLCFRVFRRRGGRPFPPAGRCVAVPLDSRSSAGLRRRRSARPYNAVHREAHRGGSPQQSVQLAMVGQLGGDGAAAADECTVGLRPREQPTPVSAAEEYEVSRQARAEASGCDRRTRGMDRGSCRWPPRPGYRAPSSRGAA
jgi:hypothetical protein